jgi:hypothetical protein
MERDDSFKRIFSIATQKLMLQSAITKGDVKCLSSNYEIKEELLMRFTADRFKEIKLMKSLFHGEKDMPHDSETPPSPPKNSEIHSLINFLLKDCKLLNSGEVCRFKEMFCRHFLAVEAKAAFTLLCSSTYKSKVI